MLAGFDSISFQRSPITTSTTMQATKLIFVALALYIATIAAGAPPKPNPPTQYTLSAFALQDNGYVSARVYYDQENQRLRTDSFDKDFNNIGELIASWETNQAAWYDATSGKCSIWGIDGTWVNSWSFLDQAEYWGEDTFIGNKQCSLWGATLENGDYLAACFNGDEPVFIGSYNGTQVEALYFITNFIPSVDPLVFTLPSTCNSATYKLSARSFMNLKKTKVPQHPLLF